MNIARIMSGGIGKRFGAPIRAIFPGRCFRYEAIDPSHENTFYQCEGIVVEQGDAIVGYLFYEVRNGFYRLLSFAVDERKRRKGVGSFMLGVLADKLDAERVEISCFVREKNVQAQLFLRSLGYQTVWAVKGFYRETDEDARRMTFRRNERAAVADFARRHRLAG